MNEPLEIHASVLGHYASGIERGRFTAHAGGRLEFARTKALLKELLPVSGRVLDVGGGPGTYAGWLTEQGLTVELFDVVPLHLEQAREVSDGSFNVEYGDARAVPRPDEYADVVLLLGPLYHLVARQDRLTALREAMRTLRPGGLLVAAGIGRLAWFLDATRNHDITDEALRDSVRATVRTGLSNPDPAPDAFYGYFHRPEELRQEVTEAGFDGVRVVAVEGLAYLLGDLDARLDDPTMCSALFELLRDLQEEPGSVESSPHLLAIAHKPRGASGGRVAGRARLRRARAEDGPWLFNLHEAAMRDLAERAYGPWESEHQRRLYAQRDPANVVEIIVIEDEGDVGVIHTRDDTGHITLDLIEVHPDAQRRGVGAEVMAMLRRRAAAEGRQLAVMVHRLNPGALRFYEREGFSRTGETTTHYLLRCAAPQPTP